MTDENATRIEELPVLPPRDRAGHKGDYGRVLVVGGSRGMIGAPALSANAALRGGAGLVTFATPETIQRTVAGLCPCATSVPLACESSGELAPRAVGEFRDAAEKADAIALGPGLAVGTRQRDLLLAALGQHRPLVLDADGLNNLARIDGWAAMRCCPLVLTPHPGEFARLTGRSIKDIQADRAAAAAEAVRHWAGQAEGDTAPAFVLVLKGAGTVVTDGARLAVNATGNPGLASGGTGDVLTGLTAALLGQQLAPFDAARLAAHLHGRAGDLAAAQLGQHSLIATDLLNYLPLAFVEHLAPSP